MDEMERRLLVEHTRALDEHSQALKDLTCMLGALFEAPNGGEVKITAIMANLENFVGNMYSGISRLESCAATVSESANKFAVATEQEQNAANMNSAAAYDMLEASRRNEVASDEMSRAARMMQR